MMTRSALTFAIMAATLAAPSGWAQLPAATCQIVKVKNSKGDTGVGHAVEVDQIRIVDSLLQPDGKLGFIPPLADPTSLAMSQGVSVFRNSYADLAQFKTSGVDVLLGKCETIEPDVGLPVVVRSFSATAPGILQYEATVTAVSTRVGMYASRSIQLRYSRVGERPNLLAGAVVLSGDRLVGIVRSPSAPETALVAADFEKAIELTKGPRRFTVDSASRAVTYDGLTFSPAEQPRELDDGDAFVIGRRTGTLPESLAGIFKDPADNLIFVREIDGKRVFDLPSMVELLSACPAEAGGRGCVPTSSWSASLPQDVAGTATGKLIRDLAMLRFEIATNAAFEEFREEAVGPAGKLTELDRMVRELHSRRAEAATPGYAGQVEAIQAYWRREDVNGIGLTSIVQRLKAKLGSRSAGYMAKVRAVNDGIKIGLLNGK
ncbi:MAG TPA: hypothetical protein VM598_01815 [Bdellovibrionota bacterium]|nr:hypothetical protein [Bdellovibrionota bacterium]